MIQINMKSRLVLFGIDAIDQLNLVQHQEFLLGQLQGLFERFYAHASEFPDLANGLKSAADMRQAKSAQIAHWRTIIKGRFDEEYEQSAKMLSALHSQLGLDGVGGIGGYTKLIADMVQLIAEAFPGQDADPMRTALQAAVTKAALLDMDVALAIYMANRSANAQQTPIVHAIQAA